MLNHYLLLLLIIAVSKLSNNECKAINYIHYCKEIDEACSASASSSITVKGCNKKKKKISKIKNTVYKNVLTPELYEMLSVHYNEFVSNDPIGGTKYVHFNSIEKNPPRNLIELLIQQVLAPLAICVGRQESLQEYVGAEWWWQRRSQGIDDQPKEFHVDSDTEVCHSSKERNCTNPDIASIFYLSDHHEGRDAAESVVGGQDNIVSTSAGGPTCIFEQYFNKFGVTPRIPDNLQLIFPKSNQYVIFNGTLLHGVLHDVGPPPTFSIENPFQARSTLLVNYWKKAPVITDQPHLFYFSKYESSYMSSATKQIQDFAASTSFKKEQIAIVKPIKVTLKDHSFDSDFDDWQSQRLPMKLVEHLIQETCFPDKLARQFTSLEDLQKQCNLNGNHYIVRLKHSVVNDQIPMNQVVPSWHLWSKP